MSSFEVNIVIDYEVLSCCKCCCCCPIGNCNWQDTGGDSMSIPATASATVTHPTAYSVRFDFDNSLNNPFPHAPFDPYQMAPYSCEGYQPLQQIAASQRGFMKNGPGVVIIKYDAVVEKHEPGYDCGSFVLYRCKGPTDNVVGTGGEAVLTFGGCSQGCAPTFTHPATTECYCNMLTIPEDQLTYNEYCPGQSHYRFEASVDSIDGSWHYFGFWRFKLSGVNTEACATPALRTLNKRKIRANLLDRMKKMSLTSLKEQKKRTRKFKNILTPADRGRVLIKGKSCKKIF